MAHKFEVNIKASSDNLEDLFFEVKRLLKESKDDWEKLMEHNFKGFSANHADKFGKSKLSIRKKV